MERHPGDAPHSATTRCDLVVVGAGPAGLAEAFWALHARPDQRVVVVEAAPVPGGWVRTEEVDGFRLELGPQALRPSDSLDALIAALGMEGEVVPASASAKLRHVGRGGRLIPVPTGPGAFLGTPLLPLSAKLRLLTEPFRRKRADVDPTESISSFVGRRFGRHAVPLVQAVVSGIFAGDADHLEVGSAFPLLAEAERQHGSVFAGMKAKARTAREAHRGAHRPKRPALLSFRTGMQTLTDRLASALGDRLMLGAAAERVTCGGDAYRVTLADGRSFDTQNLILACPARVSESLLRGLDRDLAADLGGVPYASLASVYLDLDAALIPATMRGFGFLLEPGESSEVLGGLSCSDVFPDHAPEGRFLCRMMMGGRRFPDLVDRSDEELVALATSTLGTYTGYRGPARAIRVARVHSAIPQYEEGHHARLERIGTRLRERHPGLRLRGNSYRAIALTGQLGTPTPDPV
ncbi:MAG: protoporphyrinogen oxidase [Planctomycetota bacterium]|nr:protoporphyrinogen oxidase [Planctomycetota bacterium]